MTAVQIFLAQAGWGDAAQTPLAGDASARRYIRLEQSGRTAILMQAPPEDRAGFDAFLAMTLRLRDVGLSAPDPMAAQPETGLMLLEDFGDLSFATPDGAGLEPAQVATDVLIHLAHLAVEWRLPTFTPQVMAEMTSIALPDHPATQTALATMATLFERHFERPLVPALRDFHAENLIWLPKRTGLRRVGLLDFQDAVMAPPGYDLISFTHDARRGVAPDLIASMTARYATGLNLNRQAFSTECALLIFQRNLRILGVFRRLAREREKPGYLAHLPRVYGHVAEAIRHPDLTELRTAMTPLMEDLAP